MFEGKALAAVCKKNTATGLGGQDGGIDGSMV